jgi:catechol 2,3-dioxygenase-like lactoylglutathione lyase family enzyme
MASTNEAAASAGWLRAASISPSLTANDLEQSLRFYTDGLGFEVTERHEHEGRLVYCGLRAGAAFLGIGQDDWAKGRDRVKGAGIRIWITTDQDIHELAGRAKAAGITLDSGPEPLPWGPMAFAVTDPDGFCVTIAQSRS